MAALKTIVGVIEVVLIVSNLRVRQLCDNRIGQKYVQKESNPRAKFMISKAVRRKK